MNFNIANLIGCFEFGSFEDVVSWLCCCVPYFFTAVFVLNCVFNILYIVIHLGGRK